MAGKKMLMYLGAESIYGVPGVVAIGVPSVVALGVPGKVPPWVTGDVDLGITSVVSSVFTGVVSLRSAIYVPGKVFFWYYCGSMFTVIT